MECIAGPRRVAVDPAGFVTALHAIAAPAGAIDTDAVTPPAACSSR
ncbi:hypothetical protein [Streptomyces sp. NBC_01563]